MHNALRWKHPYAEGEFGKVAALLDFDMAHRNYLIFDIANIVTQWGMLAKPSATDLFDTMLVQQIVATYAAVRSLSSKERDALAMAIPLRHCIILLMMWNRDWSTGPVSWTEYLDRFSMLDLASDSKWLELIQRVDSL